MGQADFQEVLNDGHACAKALIESLDRIEKLEGALTQVAADYTIPRGTLVMEAAGLITREFARRQGTAREALRSEP
jgi:hypothetical protein